jgi:hypothetical protein
MSARFILGGTLTETMTVVGILVLAIIGLTGFMPTVMLTIATIGLGVSFLFEEGAVASRLSDLLSEITENRVDITERGGGLGAEFIAGLGGVALGILSLVSIVPMVLTTIAAIVFGGALVLGTGRESQTESPYYRAGGTKVGPRNRPSGGFGFQVVYRCWLVWARLFWGCWHYLTFTH